MLALGLLARSTGIPASTRLQIKDEVVALDFDLAVTLRLQRYDLEILEQSNKSVSLQTANAVAWITGFGGRDPNELDEVDEDILGADIIASDKYADKNTQVM